MTKEEKKRMYRELVESGVNMPKACQFTTNEFVEKMYAEHIVSKQVKAVESKPPKKAATAAEPAAPQEEERLPMLRFQCGGWCDALGRSYERGLYRPKDRREYLALRQYAQEEV